MRKLLAAVLVTILLISTVGCKGNVNTPAEPETKAENTGYAFTKSTLDKNAKKLSERFDEIGITEADVTFTQAITFKDGTEGVVYLIRDTGAINSGIFFKYFLVVETADKYIIEEFGPFCGTTIYVNDLDGDNADEITLSCNTGGTALTKAGIVYRIENDTLCEIFHSSNKDYWDTGFKGSTKDNFMFEVTNRFTGYSSQFKFNDKHYTGFYYDENGDVIKEGKMGLLSFRKFETADKDGDGVYEIYAEQIAYLNSISDNIGIAECTIKYNTEIDDFEVISAEFISAYNMSDDYLYSQGEYYKTYRYEGRYFYNIIGKDGSVKNDIHDRVKLPDFNMLTDTLLEVKIQSGTGQSTNSAYYYDAKADKLSNIFFYVLGTNTRLVATVKLDGDNVYVLVEDIFDKTKYCKRFDGFSSPVSENCTDPIQSVTFSDDGKTIEVVYLSGENYRKTSETFEL